MLRKMVLIVSIICMSLVPFKSYANNEIMLSTNISTRMEQTGYLYKLMNGRQYRRLWSYTYSRWLEPDWTLV